MDLSLSKRGDYAIRAAITLGGVAPGGGYRKIREVAAETGIPRSLAPDILNCLAKAGLAEARAGRQGGYRLLRDPEHISLLEVVEAAEGPIRPEHCNLREGSCQSQATCPLHATWEEATQAVRRTLAATSIAALVRLQDRAAAESPSAAT